MKELRIAIVSMLLCASNAFIVNNRCTGTFLGRAASPSKMFASYELAPEPEGGTEVTAVSTMANSRMKNMGEDTDLKSEDGTVYKFWMTASADGSMIKKMRTQIVKDAAKNANFPGFRKGQVPPYAQPQMTMFALQEGIIQTCDAAVKAYGLQALKGSDGSVEVKEEVQEISKGYKVGDEVQFTGTFSATIKETASASENEESDSSEEENEG